MKDLKTLLDKNMPFIKACYAEPHRHYHTWQHIKEMLAYLGDDSNNPNLHADYWAIRAAVYFHDIVYDPKSSTNEEDSVAVFVDKVGQYIDSDTCSKISQAILSTKTHTMLNSIGTWLCFYDLKIFSAPFSRRMEFEDQIRKEYAWVPKDVYLVEREKVLRKYNAKPEHIAYMLHTIGKE